MSGVQRHNRRQAGAHRSLSEDFCLPVGGPQPQRLPRGLTLVMIEAGADVLRNYDLAGDLAADVAAWVFEAMQEARRQARSSSDRPEQESAQRDTEVRDIRDRRKE